MSAPANTPRGTPSGIALKEGFSVEIAFSKLPTVSIWCKSMKPLTQTNSETIDTTTQKNTAVKTRRPRVLNDYGPSTTFKFTYDPNCRSQIQASLVGKEGAITQWWPDNSSEDFFGYLQQAEFDEMVEGQLPEATGTIVCTNWDPVANVEVAPVYTNVSGT